MADEKEPSKELASQDKDSSTEKNHAQEDIAKKPEVVERAFRKMAEQAPEEFVQMTAMMGMMGHPLHQKMNETHITKMLDLAVQHDTNEFNLRKNQQENRHKNDFWDRWCHLFYFCIFVGLVISILILFRDQPAVLMPILTGVGGIVTGFVGGIGYARSSKKAKD